MEKKYIAALDQGTTSSRIILFDGQGRRVSGGQREFKQRYPRPGWVEHDTRDILHSVVESWREALSSGGVRADEIAAIGIANQRETVVVWDKFTGKPVYNAIVWQCRRTAEFCEMLKNTRGQFIYERTGLTVDAYFSASKIKWILDNVPYARRRAEKGELLFGTMDCYLIWLMTEGRVHATDYTNASRTLLFNIHTKQWDEALCELFGVPRCMLPEVLPSGGNFGKATAKWLGADIPVCAAVGDQQAALFGQRCVKEGDVKNTYGTGCFLLMNTGKRAVRSQNGLVTTLSATLDEPDYVLEGSVFVGGAVVQWLRDEMGFISSSAESEKLALSVPDTGGVSFVPAFVGLGAPYWDTECRGMIYGITRGTGRAHIVRAALESIALQTFDVVHAMEQDLRADISRLCVDGGASANDFLMQFQADMLGVPVERPAVTETTALGAAYLAGLVCGFYKNLDSLAEGAEPPTVFEPKADDAARAEKLSAWESALDRVLLRGNR